VVVLGVSLQAHNYELSNNHYRTQDLCRVSTTLGKALKTLGKGFAGCNTRQSALGIDYSGKDVFAECLLSGTRQKLCPVLD
jgi:hypothetical protein